MRTLFSILFYLAVLIASVVGADLALGAGLHEAFVVPMIVALAAVVVLIAQRLVPFNERWRDYKSALQVDSLHALFSTGGATALVELAVLGLALSVSDAAATKLGITLWPTAWPLALQLLAALVIAEFGAYWMHRAGHTAALWKFHALHHSSDQLYAVNSARNHPINVTYAYLGSLIPLVLLGAPSHVLLLLTVLTAVHGVLQHSNLDVTLGHFNYVFAGPELHRRHHHVEEARSHSNFGSTLALWDLVFGTWVWDANEVNDEVGLPDVSFPSNFWQHLASPVYLPRWMQVVEVGERALDATERCAQRAGQQIVDVTRDLAGDPACTTLSPSGHYTIRRG